MGKIKNFVRSVLQGADKGLSWILKYTDAMFEVLLGLRFLPPRFRTWLFYTGTSLFETAHSVFIICWGIAVAQSGHSRLLPQYKVFYDLFGESYETIFGLFAIALGITTLSIKLSPMANLRRGRILVGFILFLSAWMWVLLGGGYMSADKHSYMGMIFYITSSVFCYFTGEHIMFEVHRQDMLNGDSDNDRVMTEKPIAVMVDHGNFSKASGDTSPKTQMLKP